MSAADIEISERDIENVAVQVAQLRPTPSATREDLKEGRRGKNARSRAEELPTRNRLRQKVVI